MPTASGRHAPGATRNFVEKVLSTILACCSTVGQDGAHGASTTQQQEARLADAR